MNTDRAKTLELLKQELTFLESGGYKHAAEAPWRAAYIFEESPSCPNSSDPARLHLCEDCWLMQFVAAEFREEQVPCRFVQLQANGVTVDSLYRWGLGPSPKKHCATGCTSAFANLKRRYSKSSNCDVR